MKIFDKPNLSNKWICPICKTSDNKPVILVGDPETSKDNLMEAEQYHVDCIELFKYQLDGTNSRGYIISMFVEVK